MGATEKPVKKTAAKKPNKQKYVVKFDSSGFWLTLGLGIVCFGIGLLVVWATMTAPAGDTATTGYTTAQRLSHMMPDSAKQWLAVIFGGLFMLFGAFVFILSFKLVIQYFIQKARE